MKKIGLMLLSVLILATAVYAQDFSASLLSHSDSIKQNETAKYSLMISHPYGTPQTFEVYSTDILWDVRTKDTLIVEPGKTLETELYLRPLNLNPGLYSIPIHIKKTGTDQIVKQHVQLEVLSQRPPVATYLPAIRGTVTMARKADPKDPIRVYVRLENQNKKLLKNVQIKLRSNVINKDYDAELKPQESKKFTFEAIVDPYTSPQKDVMKVTVVVQEAGEVYQFDLNPVEFTVIEYSDFIKLKEETTKETFKTITEIWLVNEGNTHLQEKYYLPTNFIESMFTITEPESERMRTQLAWELDIPKGQTQKIVIVTNYRPLAFLITAFIVLIIAYFIFRSPIIMRKQAAVIGTQEGGISELKVLLTIRNRSKNKVKHLKIIDLVPRIASLKTDSEIGTVNPDKVVRNELQGTILKWHLDSIDPGEERLISYKIQSKLSILGGVTLPVAVAKFSTLRGKIRHSNSNKARIGFLG
ncbi:hypothetical protein GF358_04625 [Candidatus Woesearchaeota archaeon]|nr:hypothetical protein [Candidatus Woesearchaeota archaeon]